VIVIPHILQFAKCEIELVGRRFCRKESQILVTIQWQDPPETPY